MIEERKVNKLTSRDKIKDNFPKKGETCAACSIMFQKTASLLFDRVWNLKDSVVWWSPNGTTGKEIRADEILERISFHVSIIDEEIKRQVIKKAKRLSRKARNNLYISDLAMRFTSELYSKKGIEVVPFYHSETKFKEEYEPGSKNAYQAVLENLQVVNEFELSWDQVLEFRKDKQALNHYRNLRTWISDTLKGTSLEEAKNIISQRLEDYEWAIKKHGLETKIGTFKCVIDSKFITALATGGGIAGLLGGPVWAALTGSLITLSKISLYIAERKLDFEDIKRKNEIALIYEIRKEFGKPKGAR